MATIRTRIRYADDEFRVSSHRLLLDVMDARAAAGGQQPVPRPTGEAPDAAPVVARLNYGRWLADCECGSAVLLFRDEPSSGWFWCPSCGNPSAGGKLRPVLWPENREQINEAMASLPTGLAHWEPEDGQ